jgi:hypothetical protein
MWVRWFGQGQLSIPQTFKTVDLAGAILRRFSEKWPGFLAGAWGLQKGAILSVETQKAAIPSGVA